MFFDDLIASIIDGVITLVLETLPAEFSVILELIDAIVVFFQA